MNEKERINVIDDQYGCPTYAADLAALIMKIVDESSINNLSGIFNYCNEGITTWYKFALAIKELSQSNCIINPIPASEYITTTKRPMYSVLDTNKIKKYLGITIPYWMYSLQKCLKVLGYQIPGTI
jgi:dTDP-4-dehydrorhamnose reductase